MTLSLRGRLETRIFLVLTVGVLATLGLTALRRPPGLGGGDAYRSHLTVLAVLGVLGLGWELVYHALQQLRWDRDWPSVFAAAVVLNEGALLWAVLGAAPWLHVTRGSPTSFAALVGAPWALMWLFAQGPMRVLFVRWRLQGGRILCRR
jgi:hypothetical protein